MKTRYFFNKLVKSRHCFEGVLDRDGKVQDDPQDKLDIVKTFYSNLYEDKAISEQSVFFFSFIPDHQIK